MKTITYSIQKGGTGKTTISVSIAYELAKAGKKVLLIDADPQGNATTWIYSNSMEYEFYDVLTDNCDITKAICKTKYDNLYIIPTAGKNGRLKDFSDNQAGAKLQKVKKVLKPIAKLFDYCILDTSPSFGNFEKCLFYASNEIITVLKLDEFSKDGLEIFSNRLQSYFKDLEEETPKPEFNKIILNEKNESYMQHDILLDELNPLTKAGFKLYTIPQDQKFKHAQTLKDVAQNVGAKDKTIQALETITNDILKESK